MDAKTLLEKISNSFDEKNFQAALNDTEKLILMEPSNGYNYMTRGNIKKKLGDIQGFIDDAKIASKKEPNNPDYHSILAISYFNKNQYKEAIDEYSNVIKIDPNNPAAYQMRGNCLSKMGNKQAALEDYSQLIRIESNDPVGYLMRGKTFAEMNQMAQARKDLELASQMNYSESYRKAMIHRMIGNLYKKFNQSQDAIYHFKTALELYRQVNNPIGTEKIEPMQKEIDALESKR